MFPHNVWVGKVHYNFTTLSSTDNYLQLHRKLTLVVELCGHHCLVWQCDIRTCILLWENYKHKLGWIQSKVQGMKHHQESVWNATYQLAYLERSKMQELHPTWATWCSEGACSWVATTCRHPDLLYTLKLTTDTERLTLLRVKCLPWLSRLHFSIVSIRAGLIHLLSEISMVVWGTYTHSVDSTTIHAQ